MAEFNRNEYIFSSVQPIVDVSEETRKLREKQISFMMKELFLYKILIKDLVNIFPTDKDRNLILNIANYIHEDYELYEKIQKRRELPITTISKKTKMSRAFLEMWQDYILVYVIILSNPNYKCIQDYIRIERKTDDSITNRKELVVADDKKYDIKKGIVIKVNKRSVIVLTSEGEFLKLKKDEDTKVGEIHRGVEKKGIRNYKMQIFTAIVCIVLILSGVIYQYTKTTRVVVIDTTSQLKFELNRFNKVIYAYSATDKGNKLINTVKPKDKNIDKALEGVLKFANANEMIPNGSILITVSGDALKYGLLENTAKYVKEERIRVLVNNSGKQHNIKDMVKDEKDSNNEKK